MATIYIFTNIQDGKTYIGKTERSFNVRLSQHLWDAKGRSNFVFHKALRKYGLDNFHTECLEVSDKHVDLWEKHLIKRWNSRAPHGYNMTDGGDGRSGYTASEETRRKISEAHKGNKYWLGKKHTRASKQKVSKANSKKFVVTYPDGREEAIVGLKGFCSENGLDPGTMYAVASGKYKQHHGFKCRYAED